MKFNPQIGDIIVTKDRGNYVCANYREYVENKCLAYIPEYASEPICGVSEIGFCVWGYDGKAVLDAYNIAKVIPKHQATKEQDLEFRLKSLELENSMLRSLLRKEGVDV